MEIVLVHGAWCGGWVWRDLAAQLRARGRHVRVVEKLPSSAEGTAASADLAVDAAHVRAELDRCTSDVVLVGHSYGGMVITEVADHPRVAHSVYLTAFWPRAGQTLLDLASPPEVEWFTVDPDGTLRVTDDPAVARQVLGADLDPEQFADIHRLSLPQSAASFASPSTAPPRNHPTTYVVCEADTAILPADQERMAGQADVVVRLDTAHMAPMTRPVELADLLDKIGS